MTVLVTGAGGFLGGSIVRALLERGIATRSLCRGEYPWLADAGVDVVRGDVGDAKAVSAAVQGCQAVFHAAARVDIWGAYDDFHRTNTQGTAHVIAACQTHAVPKLIYTSTPSVVHGGDAVD
nr:NAD-dependent epimerase/dehydratase family protein [Deltaproteobacteria bacterium]